MIGLWLTCRFTVILFSSKDYTLNVLISNGNDNSLLGRANIMMQSILFLLLIKKFESFNYGRGEGGDVTDLSPVWVETTRK